MFFRDNKTRTGLAELRAEVAHLRDQIAEHAAEVAAERAMSQEIGERLTALDARVSSMGAELSHQLHELGTEIEQLSRLSPDSDTTAMIETLRQAQVRIATEQARYAFTFRHDLAQLADRLLRRTD
jgi:predicted  nucleic acid-binding Zn-ribbon protein